jgi:hypothetical protein
VVRGGDRLGESRRHCGRFVIYSALPIESKKENGP